MDDPNNTMEEYIRLEEEKARRRGKMYNWETATYELLFNLSWFTAHTIAAAVSDGGNRSKFCWDGTDLVRLETGPDLTMNPI
nr:hypothetical protein [Tanacetum cinerariifolium]